MLDWGMDQINSAFLFSASDQLIPAQPGSGVFLLMRFGVGRAGALSGDMGSLRLRREACASGAACRNHQPRSEFDYLIKPASNLGHASRHGTLRFSPKGR